MRKLLVLLLVLFMMLCREARAAPVFTENAVWIENEGWPYMNPNILTNNLTKVINDLSGNNIKYAFVFVGYWNNVTNDINYQHDDAYYQNVINALHAANIKAICWAEAYSTQMDIREGNRQNIYNSIVNCVNKGFDGYNDDIEALVPGVTNWDYINYLNNLTVILHSMNPSKLNMPDTFFDASQDTNQYLHVDYIVTMFYGSVSAFEMTWNGIPQGYYFWQENFGEYNGHNTPPGSPVIMGIMNYRGNRYPLPWQLNEVSYCVDNYGHPGLVGFSLWLYEYMGTNPDDWEQWNYWINRVGTSSPQLYTATIDSSPMAGVKISYNGLEHSTPSTQYGFFGTPTLNAPSQATYENHYVLIGDGNHDGGQEGYSSYTYAGGPYNLTSPANVNSAYFYCAANGNVKLAIYSSTIYDINGWVGTDYHPYMLLTQSSPTPCVRDTWITVNLPAVNLPAGIYFIAIKGDTIGIIGVSESNPQSVGGEIYGYNQFITESYSTAFAQTFPTLTESLIATNAQGAMGDSPSVYIPSSPPAFSSYNFDKWEDDSTDTLRTLNLNSNIALTAFYTSGMPSRKITGTLKDNNNQPLQGTVTAYQNSNIIGSTGFNGAYSLSIPQGLYDVQFHLSSNDITLLSVNVSSDVSNLINYVNSNSDGLSFISFKDNQEFRLSGSAPSRILLNNSVIGMNTSLNDNTYYYSDGIIHLKITPDLKSDCIYDCCRSEARYRDRYCTSDKYCSAHDCVAKSICSFECCLNEDIYLDKACVSGICLNHICRQVKTFGKTSVGGSRDASWSWETKYAARFTAPENGIILGLSFYGYTTTAGSFPIYLAVYTDSSGSPGTLVGSGSGTITNSPRWYNVTGLSIPVTAGNAYWLAINYPAVNVYYYYNTGATNQLIYQTSYADTEPPDNLFGTGTYLAREMSIYASYIAS